MSKYKVVDMIFDNQYLLKEKDMSILYYVYDFSKLPEQVRGYAKWIQNKYGEYVFTDINIICRLRKMI